MRPIARKVMLPFLVFALLLTACGNKGSGNTGSGGDTPSAGAYDVSPLAADSPFSYDEIDGFMGIAVDENGILYTGAGNPDNKIIDHSEKADWRPSRYATAYDLDGNILARYDLNPKMEEGFLAPYMAAGGGKLYYSAVYSMPLPDFYYITKSDVIYALDLTTGGIIEHILPVAFDALHKLAYFGGKLYMLAEHPDYEDFYILASFDIVSGDFEIIYENLDSFALTPDGNILIAGRDTAGGFFAEIDSDTWTMNNIKSIEVGTVSDMAADERGVFFTALPQGNGDHFRSFCLGYTFLDSDSSAIIVRPDRLFLGIYPALVYTRGLCWFVSHDNNFSQKTLERIKVSDYVREPLPIKMLSSFAGAHNDTFGGGFALDWKRASNEELALSMLSQDRTYDVFLATTHEIIAHNIKEKGAFYPLGDVPFVQEYMDACFPFIKDAATDDAGEIWMIPITVTVSFFLFLPENAAEAGLDIPGAKTPSDVLRFLTDAYNAGGSYYFYSTAFRDQLLYKYLREDGTFDTPQFRSSAEAFRETVNLKIPEGTAHESDSLYNTEFLFSHYISPFGSVNGVLYRFDTDAADKFDVIPILGTSGNPSAYTEFLCVNPYSDNLDAALEFISSVCQYRLGIKNSFYLTDMDTYSDSQLTRKLYALYESAVIDFSMPHEIYLDNFLYYLVGRMSLDEMIAESDRALNMYLGE
ncbi:MAG: hypothetical protein FWH17_04530 [Oscillospiraceae bacterium]|nr:hypothetical protein [Oscillospiraceae bacterium]